MNKKSVAAIITFAVTFGFSAFLMSFFAPPVQNVRVMQLKNSNETRDKILRLLDQDIRNGDELERKLAFLKGNHNLPFHVALTRYANNVKTYSDLSGSLNDADLPQDFQRAWRKHMRAWQSQAALLEEQSNFTSDNRLNDFEFANEHQNRNDEIESTWYEVLGVAGKYGAFPENAY